MNAQQTTEACLDLLIAAQALEIESRLMLMRLQAQQERVAAVTNLAAPVVMTIETRSTGVDRLGDAAVSRAGAAVVVVTPPERPGEVNPNAAAYDLVHRFPRGRWM